MIPTSPFLPVEPVIIVVGLRPTTDTPFSCPSRDCTGLQFVKSKFERFQILQVPSQDPERRMFSVGWGSQEKEITPPVCPVSSCRTEPVAEWRLIVLVREPEITATGMEEMERGWGGEVRAGICFGLGGRGKFSILVICPVMDAIVYFEMHDCWEPANRV